MITGKSVRSLLLVTLAALISLPAQAAVVSSTSTYTPKKSKSNITESSRAKAKMKRVRHRRRRYVERFYTSSFADDVTSGDVTAGEDPVVRAAAVEALGNMNGTVVAIDPMTGRILTMVNQKLALSEGAQPCSTFKVAVALAALSEKVVEEDTEIRTGRRRHFNMTEALAHSNNPYFESLGRQLGFDKVSEYAHQFGMGELAGYNIEGEHLGEFPSAAPAFKDGGVGKMCSYGESISMTPLQLGALMGAIANGGTLYFLQHPQSQDEVAAFTPLVKRQLAIAEFIPDISDGMRGAVSYGTARRLNYNFSEEQVLGKTGTCSKDGTRFGWFASYANTDHGRIVVVVFLRGGRPTFGPKAAEIAGRVYRNLYDHSFFAAKLPAASAEPSAPATTLNPN